MAPEKGPAEGGSASARTELSAKVRESLEAIGVFNTLFPEVARAGWNDDELLALAAWCRTDNLKRPGGLFIVRLRGGLTAPDDYFQPPCPSCGQYGEHASTCTHRMLNLSSIRRGEQGIGELVSRQFGNWAIRAFPGFHVERGNQEMPKVS